MGYEVHITRAESWLDSDATPITLEEWLAHVAGDPELRLDAAAEAPLADGSTLRYESEGLAVWTAYSGHGEDGNMAWLDHRDGHVVVKNPDEEILGKLCEVAAALGARVQGDDGETYPDPGAPGLQAKVGALEGDAAAGTQIALPELLARPLRAIHALLRRAAPLRETPTRLRMGQRYRYLIGGEPCTVVAVDPRAEHGMGLVTVRFDDGRELSLALIGDTESMFLPLDEET